jgi:hypothetical protein
MLPLQYRLLPYNQQGWVSAAVAKCTCGFVADTSTALRPRMCVHVPDGQPLFAHISCSLLSAASHSTSALAAPAAGACRYTEGVSDLQGSSISLAGPPQLLWGDASSGSEAGAAAQTWVNTLQVDRGVSFEVRYLANLFVQTCMCTPIC